MAEPNGKLRLPRLVRASFRHFTLYNLEREIDIEFPDGVFCLAGANGLGKSTFLLAINYAITGRVPADRDFISLEDYYEKTEDFSRDFFDGRIGERDRDRAEVEVQLRIGKWELCLIRGMFEPEGLRALWLQQDDGDLHEVQGSPHELHEQYRREITTRTGLASFEQLVFLQHFVLTFDERRHLLFWKRRELDQTLHLSFGVSETARRADMLQDKAQKADSQGRNTVSHASAVRKKLRELEQVFFSSDTDGLDDIEAKHKELEAANERVRARADKLEASLRDANLRLAELSAKQATLRAEYDFEFARRLATAADIRHHPLIRGSIADGRCQLCDSHRDGIAADIEGRLKGNTCPLCGGKVTKQGSRKEFTRLKELDKQLATASSDLADAIKKVERLKTNYDVAASQQDAAFEALEQFSSTYRKEITRLEAKSTAGLKGVLDEYRKQIDELEAEKQKRYKERNKYLEELRPLQHRLERQYNEAENVFVPMFKELAERFLGMDLNVVFELSKPAGAGLVLDVQSNERREQHQLSESQRFFVDIALRMALIKHMSAQNNPGCLYLDTPEGSLDIAYETRAGQMIAKFAQDGFGCVMTANINTSRLLLSLAEGCDSGSMVLHRMTSWAQLSQVQVEQEDLFDDAFNAIEKKIKRRRRK